METLLVALSALSPPALYSWLALVTLIIAVKAIAPIVSTTITEREKTRRAVLASSLPSNSIEKVNAQITEICMSGQFMNAQPKQYFGIGLVSTWLGLAQLALLQFGPERSAPLSIGAAVSIVQALTLLLLGGWLLFRR